MSKDLYAVYGASGCGRGVMPLARSQLARQGIEHENLFFVDDAPGPDFINGNILLTYKEFLEKPASHRYVVLAIANSEVREKLSQRLQEDGVSPWSVFAENTVTMDAVQIGEGAIISPFVTLTSNIKIGKYFQANIYSYVEHDCAIGDYVTFAPGVHCNGNIMIEDHVYIGSGAVIKQGKSGKPLVIGKGSVIGMGAVVTKSVPPGVTVVGNPARILVK